MSTADKKIPNTNETPRSLFHKWGMSPYPAWTFSAALLASPMLRPPLVLQPIAQEAQKSAASKLFSTKARPVSAYPSNAQVLVFSAFVGLGGFMCFDKDPQNGSAVAATWSFLYFLSTVKKSVWNLKMYPKALTSLALVNTAAYAANFFNVM